MTREKSALPLLFATLGIWAIGLAIWKTTPPPIKPSEETVHAVYAPTATEAWADEQVAWFTKDTSSIANMTGLPRPLAKGVGTYQKEEIGWFAYANEGDVIEFDLSTQISYGDITRLQFLPARSAKQWKVSVPATDHGPGTQTWIAMPIPWMREFCNKELTTCANSKAIDEAVAELESVLEGSLHLAIIQHLK